MRIGVILDSRASATELAELAALAERSGLSAVWSSSLLDSRDPFVNWMPAAAATRAIGIGPIAVNPYDTHPVRICSSLLTFNEAANGRAHIVIGGGGEALEALGIEPTKRVRAVREAIEILTRAGPDAPLTYEGGLFSVKNYHPFWATAPKPRIWAGANMPQMLAMAAKAADGIFFSDLTAPLAADAVKSVRTRTERTLAFNNFFAWHVYDDRTAGRAEARQWLALRGLFRRWVVTTFLSDADYDVVERNMLLFFEALAKGPEVLDAVPAHILDALVDNLTLNGGPEDADAIAAKLAAFRDAGLTDIALRLYRDPAASIRFIAERILPALG